MKKIVIKKQNLANIFVLLVTAVMLSGCFAFSVAPVTGILYTEVTGPFDATGSEGEATLVGTAECTSILGLIATGDCSIQAAMEAGGITEVDYVDFESSNILGIYATFVTVVHGR